MYIHLLHLGRIGYGEGLALQARLVEARKAGEVGDTLLLLEHPPVITLGRNSARDHVIASDEFLAQRGVELHEINRGGDVTYHGPGQLVGYPIVDLRGEWPGKRGPGMKHLGPVDFVRMLEEVLIRVCSDFGVMAKRIPKITGVWTFGGEDAYTSQPSTGAASEPAQAELRRGTQGGDAPVRGRHAGAGSERKLAAIGVHVSQGVTSHGFALNVTTDLRDFAWIVPCGIRDRGVTSLELEADGRLPVTMENAVHATARSFGHVFGRQMLWAESVETVLGAAVE